MEEQLIGPGVAVMAKRKGFTTGTTGIYEWIDGCEAVPQSVLERWLREKHNKSVKVDDFTVEGKVRYDYNVSELGSQHDNPIGIFVRFEYAKEAGLMEALQSLKDV